MKKAELQKLLFEAELKVSEYQLERSEWDSFRDSFGPMVIQNCIIRGVPEAAPIITLKVGPDGRQYCTGLQLDNYLIQSRAGVRGPEYE